MNKKTIVIFLVISVVIGIFLGFVPETKIVRNIDILAPDSVIRNQVERFKTFFDTTSGTFHFNYIPHGDTTRLTWVFAPTDKDEVMVKLYWLYKKNAWTKEVMDRTLEDIKNLSEGRPIPQR